MKLIIANFMFLDSENLDKQKFPLHTFDSNFSINEALETIYELECMFREFGLTNFCAYIDSFGKLESYKIYNVI